MIILRRAFVTASIAWAVLLPIAPFAASQPAPARFWYGLGFVVYGAGTFVCHQLPWRSFHLWAAQMPVLTMRDEVIIAAGDDLVPQTHELRRLLVARRRSFPYCVVCACQMAPESQFDADVCQGCASEWLNVVF